MGLSLFYSVPTLKRKENEYEKTIMASAPPVMLLL